MSAELVTRVASIAHHIDRKEWRALRALFAPKVAVDYTALFGGEPKQQTPDELVGGWEKSLAEVATQHLFGPIVLTNATRAECHVRAFHCKPGAPGGEEWEVLGHYLIDLTPTISALTLQVYGQRGNRTLLG